MTLQETVVRLVPPTRTRRSSDRIALTPKKICSLLATGHRQRIADAQVIGLFIVISPAGAKSYVIRGRIGGGRTQPKIDVTIGRTDVVPLTEARKRAAEILAEMRIGIDPRRRASEKCTVKVMAERFIADRRARGVVSADRIESYLHRALSRLGETPAVDITRDQLTQRIRQIAQTSGPAAAKRARSALRAMAKWSADDGLIPPATALVFDIPEPALTKTEATAKASRQALRWTLRQSGWPAFWSATEVSTDPIFTALLRILMLTGQRKGETSLARWADIDLDKGVWTLPARNRKIARDHHIPLGALTREVIATLPRGGPDQLLMPGRGGKPISGWTQRLSPVVAFLGQQIAPHGLRRGYRTALTELGADTDLGELMIGHSRRGIEATYDISERWADRTKMQDRLEHAIAEKIIG